MLTRDRNLYTDVKKYIQYIYDTLLLLVLIILYNSYKNTIKRF